MWLQMLTEACAKTRWEVRAYCLVRHHFHLVCSRCGAFTQFPILSGRVMKEELNYCVQPTPNCVSLPRFPIGLGTLLTVFAAVAVAVAVRAENLAPKVDVAAAAQVASPKPGYPIITADIGLNRIVKYDADGAPVWTYDKVSPIDVWALPDGTVLMAYLPSPLTTNQGGVRLVGADQQTLFDFAFDDEIMSVQPLADGNFLMAECHCGRVTELNRLGQRITSFSVKTAPCGHKTMRQIRLTARGTIIVGECYSHKLREYDRAGRLLKEHDLEYPYCPQPLPNGHTLVACWNAPQAQVVELDAAGQVAWRLTPAELPKEMAVSHIAESIRLPSGNTLVSASCKAAGGAVPRAMLFEVTPDKQVVWQMTDRNSSTWLTAAKRIPSWTPAFPKAEKVSGSALDKQPPQPASKVTSDIVFAERHPGRDPSQHYYANFGYACTSENEWLHGADGARLCRLDPRTGRLTVLLNDPQGGIRDPQVSYDAQRILFSYRKGGTHHYNLHEIGADGTGLRQITRGDWDDVEPAYLPDGGIAFCSSRCKRYVLCWLAPVAILFRCNADGTGLRMLSSGSVTENTPSILPDGRILYTRWDYVNRDAVSFHHLWTMNPDGTEQQVYYGNQTPGEVFIDAQPIPQTREVVFIDSGYHGSPEHAGKVMIVSELGGPNTTATLRSITAQADFRDPYPVLPGTFLVARGNEILLLDDAGKTTQLYAGSQMVHEPRPLRSRPLERIIPARVDLTANTATFFVADVHLGRTMQGVKRGDIKKLLVLEDLPKPVNYHGGGTTPIAHGGTWSLKRILGTVPVAADGSAYFEVPALRSIYLALLDANDRSVKQMRSFVTLQPGEQRGCIGCHETRIQAPPAQHTPEALRQAPDRIEPIAGVPEVLDFPRDIQPVLDRHCVTCHNAGKRAGGVVLTGDRGPTYSLAYYNLMLHQQIKDGAGYGWANIQNVGGRPIGNDVPNTTYSSASPLMDKIGGQHHDVKLSDTERTLVRLWIDTAAQYAGTYAAYGTGQIGAWWRNNEPIREMADQWPTTAPAKDAVERRCAGCHAQMLPRFVTDKVSVDDFGDLEGWQRPTSRFSRHTVFNLTRPEKSLALMAPLSRAAGGYASGAPQAPKRVAEDRAHPPKPVAHPVIFTSAADPDYQKILMHLQAAQARLDEIKRFDMPGFKPRREYGREMARFGILPSAFDPAKDPIDVYATDRAYWKSLWHQPAQP